MNAVEIEAAVSALAERPFDAAEFPFTFLQAFGNKETTIKRLRAGASNKSDLGGVLHRADEVDSQLGRGDCLVARHHDLPRPGRSVASTRPSRRL